MNEYSRNYQIRWSDRMPTARQLLGLHQCGGRLRYHFFSERNFPPEKFVELGTAVYTAIHARFFRNCMGETVTISYA
jgi:hypothetical protein